MYSNAEFSKLVCEFQGSKNLALDEGKIDAAKEYSSAFSVEHLNDNHWGLDKLESSILPKTYSCNSALLMIFIHFISERSYTMKRFKGGMIAISFPMEYGIQKVVFLPRLDSGGHLHRFLRVLVSNEQPSNCVDESIL